MHFLAPRCTLTSNFREDSVCVCVCRGGSGGTEWGVGGGGANANFGQILQPI